LKKVAARANSRLRACGVQMYYLQPDYSNKSMV
jgi:hypothetical protein